jgi:hypothetical protein
MNVSTFHFSLLTSLLFAFPRVSGIFLAIAST